MKGFLYGVFGGVSAIVGSVIGAGFITGAEIARFFSETFLLPACALLFILLFAFSFFLMYAGKMRILREKGHFYGFFHRTVTVVCFITLCGMCAGADALVNAFLNLDERLPTISPLLLLGSFFICKRGTGGIKTFNAVLVPFMVAAIFSATRGGSPIILKFNDKPEILTVFLYAAMNCFSASELLGDIGKDRGTGEMALTAALSALIVSACVMAVMSKISREGREAESLPLLSSLKGGAAYYIFSVITLFGIVTTLVSSHYPLVKFSEKSPLNLTLNACFALSALALSRFGFFKIVRYAYPAIGALGLVYCLCVCIWGYADLFSCGYFFKQGNKRVHTRCKQAQNERCGIHEIEFEHLPPVHNKVTDAGSGNKVFAHYGAYPGKPDVDLKHTYERG